MKSVVVLLTVLVTMSVWTVDVRANVVFDENFDSYPTGTTPSPPWDSVIDPIVSVTIDDSIFVSGKSLHIDDPGNGVQAHLWQAVPQTPHLQLEFYMRTHNGNHEGIFVYLEGDGGTDYTVNFGNAGGTGFAGYISLIGWNGGWEQPKLAYSENTWYYVRRTLNCTTNTGSFYVEEVGSPSNSAYWSIGSNYVNSYINKINIVTSGSQGADGYIDEIRLTAIPEPGTISLLLAGVMAFMRCKRG